MIDSGVDSLDLDLDQDLVKSVHDVNCVEIGPRAGPRSLDLDYTVIRNSFSSKTTSNWNWTRHCS